MKDGRKNAQRIIIQGGVYLKVKVCHNGVQEGERTMAENAKGEK